MSSQTVVARPQHLDYSKTHLPEPPTDFYHSLGQQIIPCCGYEFGTPDFHSAFELINNSLKLGLDPIDCKVFSLMLTGLAQATRFGGDPHISPIMGENSAAHTVHSMILATEVFRSCGLLSAGRQTPQCMKMRLDITLGLLMHDMGEILGEISSVAQRATNPSLMELPGVEREIVSIVLREAYRSVTDPALGPAAFYAFLRDMRDAAGIGCGENGATDLQRLSQSIGVYTSKQTLMPPLASTYEQRVCNYLSLFDVLELKDSEGSRYDAFVRSAGKIIEHIQGARHHLRFAAQDTCDIRLHLTVSTRSPSAPQGHWLSSQIEEMVPVRLTSSFRMKKSAGWMHQGLHSLGKNALSENEEALAHEIRKRLYQVIAEFFSVTRPIINRDVQQENEMLANALVAFAQARDAHTRFDQLTRIRSIAQDMLDEDAKSLARQGDSPERGTKLRPLETRSRLMKLYIEAARVDFKPECDTALWLLEETPIALRNFDQINLGNYFPPGPNDLLGG